MSLKMKFNGLVMVFVCLTSFYACEKHDENPESLVSVSSGEVTEFATAGFEQTAEVEIPFSVDKVFPLFEPKNRNLVYGWLGATTILRESLGANLKNLVTVNRAELALPGGTGEFDIFLIVTKYDPSKSYIQYLVQWGDFELQRIDITCEQGTTANSTRVIWTEFNAGIDDYGVTPVTGYVKGGYIVSTLRDYARAAEAFLQKELNGEVIESTLKAKKQADPVNFPTVGFKQTVVANIPFAVEKVAPLFEPAGRTLLYDWWKPTVIREENESSLNNLFTVSQVDGIEVFLAVQKHEADKNYLQYIVLWGDFELQRIDITCEQGATANETKVTWTEWNAGFHSNGVSMVTQFVTSGVLSESVERYAKNVEAQLNGHGTNGNSSGH